MSAGCTVIVYNGITLLNVQMRDFRCEAVKDESGTDLIYQRFTLRAVGYFVNMSNYPDLPLTVAIAASGTGPGGQNQNQDFSASAGYNYAQVRHALMEQRGNFTLQMGCNPDGSGGTPVIQAFPAADLERAPQDPIDPNQISAIDVNNGPKSNVIDITHVSADECLKCTVDFEVCLLECNRDVSQAPQGLEALAPAVLSNRWKVIDVVDRNQFTTRTYNGTLRLASLDVNPNDFRGWVVAPLYPGYRRDSMTFDVSLDGLSLVYTVVDKEIAYSAPDPATTWRFLHTETTGTGKQLFGELAVTLGGDRTAPRPLFISMIAAMIDNVLRVPDPTTPSGWADGQFFEEISFTDEITDDSCLVHGHARITRSPIQLTNGEQTVVGTFKYVFGATLCIPLDQIQQFQQDLGEITVNDPDLGGPLPYNDVYAWPYDSNRSRGCLLSTVTDNQPDLAGPLGSATALACYLQDPCNALHAIQPLGNDVSNDVPTTNQGLGNASGAPTVTVRVTPAVPQDQSDDPNQAEREQYYGLYGGAPDGPQPGPTTHHKQQSKIEQKPGARLQLPLQQPPPQSGGGSPESQNPPPPPTPGPQYDPNQGPAVPPTFPTPFIEPWQGASLGTPPDSSGYTTGPNCIFVSMTAPLYQRVVSLEAERVGDWPLVPPPVDIIDSSGQTMSQYILDYKIVPQAPDFTSDGQQIYRVACEYRFGLDRPPSLAGFPVGLASWTSQGYLWTGNLFGQDQDGSGNLTALPA